MAPFAACCAHDHDCEDNDCGTAWSLHTHINLQTVRCLNEAVENSAREIFRPWAKRLDPSEHCLQSNDDDPELLLHIPFDGAVKLRAICIIGEDADSSPSEVRAFVNRDDLDFSSVADVPPTQKWDLVHNPRGEIELPTQVTKFNGVHSLDLHFPGNLGASSTSITFIGLKGDFSERKREAVTAVYEVLPVPGPNNKIPGTEGGAWGSST